MTTLFFHLVHLIVAFLGCLMLLWWLALMLHYHERTKEKLFWWIAIISLMAWTYAANTAPRMW
jgi:hypothetical protein